MNPNLIAGIVAFLLGLLCGFGPTSYYYRAEETKRVLDEKEAADAARIEADKQRQETANAWAANLEKILADKGAYERCVAAGRCGAVVRVLRPNCEAGGVPPPGKPDAAGAGAIPSTAGTSEATVETAVAGLIADCKKAVGQANALQADIERQPQWAK